MAERSELLLVVLFRMFLSPVFLVLPLDLSIFELRPVVDLPSADLTIVLLSLDTSGR